MTAIQRRLQSTRLDRAIDVAVFALGAITLSVAIIGTLAMHFGATHQRDNVEIAERV